MSVSWLRNPVGIGILALLALILMANSLVIVPETRQAVVFEFQQFKGVKNQWKPNQDFGRSDAGLLFKWPFIDNVVWVDKRVLDVDLENQTVLSTDQLRLEVDAFARFQVIDPRRMVVTAGSERRVADALKPILGSALRNELGKRPFAALLSPERGAVMDNIQAGLQHVASQYGVRIIDVRIRHADLPSGSPLESALNRMRTARQQEALTIRAQGQKRAQLVRADADAQAAQTYAQSFGKDPDFYDFYRAMQSYRHTFGADGTEARGETSIILSPSNDYLREFTGRR